MRTTLTVLVIAVFLFPLTLIRCQGQEIEDRVETSPHGEVIYDHVEYRGGYIRTIINKPETEGKHPTIFFIPGYNCVSVANMPPIHPYQKLLTSFIEKGYAVVRVEKPGMGECKDTPSCFDIDFHTEQEAFEKGYESLKKYDFIDPEKVFVFGHSLGGIAAPVLAAKYKPKGVIVYGTRHEPWAEYLVQMLRFQNPYFGIDPIENEKDMVLYHELLYQHYVKKVHPKKLAENPEYARLLKRDFQYDGEEMLFQRHYTFWQDLQDLNLTKYWAETESHVLSLYGEADIEAINPTSHEMIVQIVNHYHPGKATYQLVPGTNHSLIKVGTMAEGVEIRQDRQKYREYLTHHFNYEMVENIHQWIQDKL